MDQQREKNDFSEHLFAHITLARGSTSPVDQDTLLERVGAHLSERYGIIESTIQVGFQSASEVCESG